jgi:SHS2 domain-containing protein
VKPYEFFEHTADIGARVYGATLPELFVNAARAMYEAMGELREGEGRKTRDLAIEAATLEDLLHDWLAELLFEFEAHHTLYDEFEFSACEPGRLAAELRGAKVDFSRSAPREEIKAVTYHQLRVEQLPDNSWQATVIFDV